MDDKAPFAGLDLHSERHDLSSVLTLADAEAVAASVAGLLSGLFDSVYTGDERPMPSWFDDHVASDRIAVWTAVGMLLAEGGLHDVSALTRLPAYAYSHDLTLDDTAAQLLDRDLHVDDVLT